MWIFENLNILNFWNFFIFLVFVFSQIFQRITTISKGDLTLATNHFLSNKQSKIKKRKGTPKIHQKSSQKICLMKLDLVPSKMPYAEHENKSWTLFKIEQKIELGGKGLVCEVYQALCKFLVISKMLFEIWYVFTA